MKKSFSLILLSLTGFVSFGAVHLSENFNSTCPEGNSHPNSGWESMNTISTTVPQGMWTCGAAYGRYGTPGIKCTGYYSAAFHLDTSYLITAPMLLNDYPGNAYLNFDSKADEIHLGGRLEILVSADSVFTDSTTSHPVYNRTSSTTPVLGIPDSSGWVTHQVDITPFKSSTFYVAFRYTSTTTAAGAWYLDNVNSTPTPLEVQQAAMARNEVSLSASPLGNGDIRVFYTVPQEGAYTATITDMTGREVSRTPLVLHSTSGNITIDNGDLKPGLYIIRFTGTNSAGSVKVAVP